MPTSTLPHYKNNIGPNSLSLVHQGGQHVLYHLPYLTEVLEMSQKGEAVKRVEGFTRRAIRHTKYECTWLYRVRLNNFTRPPGLTQARGQLTSRHTSSPLDVIFKI